jgi:protein-tyrosine-phosphatase
MIPQLSDEISWAMRVGARLQMLQASFADDDAAARTGYVEEEIERALREVPAARRPAYLQALAERFPSWETRAPVRSASASQSSAPRESAPETPEALVNRLTAMAAELSNDARWTLSYRLQQAGFSISVPSAATAAEADEVPPELQKRLSIEAGQTIDRKRALRLTAVLIDLVVTMDQVSWSLWKNLAPNSIVRRDPGPTGDLRKLAGPYLLGDNEVSTTQLTQVLDKTRQLMAGLLAAIGATGEAFARQFLSRYSPQAIKELAEAEPGFFIGAEQKCWRKYIEAFNELSGVAIENEIAATIAKYTENLILGSGRSSAPPSDTGT